MRKYKTFTLVLPLVFGFTAFVVPKQSDQQQTASSKSSPSKTRRKAGSEQLSTQIQNCLVRSIVENGSLDFTVSLDQRALVHNSVPVEAEAEDVDGVTIHILLHVIDGIAQGIEVYKEDLSPVVEFPVPAKLRLFSPL